MISYIAQARTPASMSSGKLDSRSATLTERVSKSPSGEYRTDIITCLLDTKSNFAEVGNWDRSVRDGGRSTTQVHRYEYLCFILRRDKPTLYHRLDGVNTDNRQQYHLCDTDGNDGSYRQARDRTRNFNSCEEGPKEDK